MTVIKESVAELRRKLKEAEKAEKLEAQRAKDAYEKKRDETVFTIMNTCSAMAKELEEFKTFCHIKMDEQALELTKYGKIRSDSKGGFTLTNSDSTLRITRRRDTQPSWDERSNKAIELIKEFLGDTIKKRDVKLYEILIKFLERNSNGDLEYGRVMDLIQHEDKFDDERWKEGLRLIKESYSNNLKGFGYEFKTMGKDGKWQTTVLNFSSI